MTKRTVCGVLALGVVVGFWLDDPNDVVHTETVTQRVEVPGPAVVRSVPIPLPDSCLNMIDTANQITDAIKSYSDVLGPQFKNLNDAAGAVAMHDVGDINAALTIQRQVQLDSAGPLSTIIDLQDDLATRRTKCASDMEDDK